MSQTLHDLLTTDIVDALHHEDPFEQTVEERATAIVDKILPTLREHLVADLPASFGTHLELLAEWMKWWLNPVYLSAQLPDNLHARTAAALEAASAYAVRVDPEQDPDDHENR